MSTDLKIDYLELPADDFDGVERFYTTVFGWAFTDFGPDYRAFSDNKLDGGFYRSILKSRTENGATLVVIYAEKLEETEQRIVANGGEICRPTFSFPGGRRFHFHDPHGNELAVWSDR